MDKLLEKPYIKYPQNLNFEDKNLCDVCNSTDCESYSIFNLPGTISLGWQICSSEQCLKTFKKWKKETTISKQELDHVFEKVVNVIRSCGKIENNWFIAGDAYLPNKHGEWLVNVKKIDDKKTKCVSLIDLGNWNKIDFLKEDS